jgi:hypothetical protein
MAAEFSLTGAYLAPSAVIGLGAWGREVAREVESALWERSPGLVRACPVLALDDDEPAALELIRAHLRASRMADVIRALEREGLMKLDPVLPPPTHVYLIVSLADDPDLTRLKAATEHVGRAAQELKATALKAAFVDLGPSGDGGALPAEPLPFRVYVTEPVTAHGLVLDPAEYRAAVVEALVAAAQPGGSAIFAGSGASGLAVGRAGGPGGVGTLGIAWLRWNPADLRAVLAKRLSRDAIRHCLAAAASGPAAGRVEPRSGRLPALLQGLPLRPATGATSGSGGRSSGDDTPALDPDRDLFGNPAGRRHMARHFRRCVAAVPRRVERWQARIRENGWTRAQAEAEALEQSVAGALAAGPDGLARATALLDAVTGAAARRLEATPPAPDPLPRTFEPLRRLEQAERLPELRIVLAGLALVAVVSTLVGRAGGASIKLLLVWWVILGLAGLAYVGWRPQRIRRRTAEASAALARRACRMAETAVQLESEGLDRLLEERCRSLRADLARAGAALAERCRPEAQAAGPAPQGALAVPWLDGPAVEPLYAQQQGQVPDLAAHLAAGGCLTLLRDPDALIARAEAQTREYLAERLVLDPGQVAAQACGDRLAERLQESVSGLLHWSRPLLARGAAALPEGDRWLLWPEGLPCPPVPPGVQVLTGARGCTAAITVIQNLPPEARPHRPAARAADVAT